MINNVLLEGEDNEIHLKRDLAKRIHYFTEAELTTEPLKSFVNKIEGIVRQFKYSCGLAAKRSVKNLSGDALTRYRESNKRRQDKFYEKNKLQILADQKQRYQEKVRKQRDEEKIRKNKLEKTTNGTED